MDSAKLRMKMLELDLNDQKERIQQQETLDEIKDKNDNKNDIGSV